MSERWVVNASPLIVLAKVGHAHLLALAALAAEIVAPQAVVAEIEAGPPDDPARAWLCDFPLPIVATPPPRRAAGLGFGQWGNGRAYGHEAGHPGDFDQEFAIDREKF
jgi:hypothetical protein